MALNVDQLSSMYLAKANEKLSKKLNADCIFINSDLYPKLDELLISILKDLKAREESKNHLVVILESNGGIIEIVERMVNIIRTHYKKLTVIIPNFAYSAGTVFAFAANVIFMSELSNSKMGPIDPQHPNKDGRYVPGFGILYKYESLIDKINKASSSNKVRAELAILLDQFDVGEIFEIEQSILHGTQLVSDWLSTYLLNNWKKMDNGNTVTNEIRIKTAQEIAELLSDASYWHSHGRGITMNRLMNKYPMLGIKNYDSDSELSQIIEEYYVYATDYFLKSRRTNYIHSIIGVRQAQIII